MVAKEFNPAHLDVETFAKAGASLHGHWPVAQLRRLHDAVVNRENPTAPVTWRARGESRPVRVGGAQVWLHIEADTAVELECQRCLKAVQTKVHAQRSFLFVAGESAAAELDANSEDDVLALTRTFDLCGLIEDELLLELPLVPRHDACPVPLPLPPDAESPEEATPNPFAVLAALKRGRLSN